MFALPVASLGPVGRQEVPLPLRAVHRSQARGVVQGRAGAERKVRVRAEGDAPGARGRGEGERPQAGCAWLGIAPPCSSCLGIVPTCSCLGLAFSKTVTGLPEPHSLPTKDGVKVGFGFGFA